MVLPTSDHNLCSPEEGIRLFRARGSVDHTVAFYVRALNKE